MRVGIYIGSYKLDPKEGGGFTFVSEIVLGLKKFISEKKTDHEYFLLYSGLEEVIDQKFNFVSLDRLFPQYSSVGLLIRRIIRIIVRILSIGKFRLFEEPSKEDKVDKAVDLYKLDLVWNISAGAAIRAPFVSTVWDLDHRVTPFFPEVSVSGWTWDKREFFYSSILPRSTYIITGTETGKKDIALFYRIKEERIKVIPFPTPSFALDKQAVSDDSIFKKLNISKNDGYLFCPAQFWPHKNHIGALMALKNFNAKYKLNFKIVFSGSDKGNLGFIKDFVQKNDLQNVVSFAGFVSVPELIALYKNSFALLFLSYMGFDNLPPLEAMGLGCPCVVSSISGHQQQLGSSAVYVDPNNEEIIADKLFELYQNKELRNDLVKQGFNRANSWVVSDYIQSMDNVLSDFAKYRRNWVSGLEYTSK